MTIDAPNSGSLILENVNILNRSEVCYIIYSLENDASFLEHEEEGPLRLLDFFDRVLDAYPDLAPTIIDIITRFGHELKGHELYYTLVARKAMISSLDCVNFPGPIAAMDIANIAGQGITREEIEHLQRFSERLCREYPYYFSAWLFHYNNFYPSEMIDDEDIYANVQRQGSELESLSDEAEIFSINESLKAWGQAKDKKNASWLDPVIDPETGDLDFSNLTQYADVPLECMKGAAFYFAKGEYIEANEFLFGMMKTMLASTHDNNSFEIYLDYLVAWEFIVKDLISDLESEELNEDAADYLLSIRSILSRIQEFLDERPATNETEEERIHRICKTGLIEYLRSIYHEEQEQEQGNDEIFGPIIMEEDEADDLQEASAPVSAQVVATLRKYEQ